MYQMYKKTQSAFIKVFTFFVFAASIFIPVALAAQTFTRYVLHSPIVGIEELASLAFVEMVLFGSAIVYKDKKYIAIDAFIKRFKGRARVAVNVAADTLTAVVLALLLYAFYIALPVQHMFRTGIFGVPKSVYAASLLVVFTFIFVCCVESILKGIVLVIHPERITTEGDAHQW